MSDLATVLTLLSIAGLAAVLLIALAWRHKPDPEDLDSTWTSKLASMRYSGSARYADAWILDKGDWNAPPKPVEIEPGMIIRLPPHNEIVFRIPLETSMTKAFHLGVPLMAWDPDDAFADYEPQPMPPAAREEAIRLAERAGRAARDHVERLLASVIQEYTGP